jgi:putative ABC transport system permease protein
VPPNLKLALRNVLRHRRRSGPAVGAIAFGTVAILLAGGFVERIFVDFREDTIHSQLGHLQVSREGFRQRGQAAPFSYILPDNSPALRQIGDDPRVSLVVPRLSFSGLISAGDTTLSFIGEGVDPGQDAALSKAVTVSAGNPLAVDDPSGVVLGEGLASNLGIKPGDTVVLLATTSSGGTNAVEARVRGTFFTVTKAYDDTAVRVPLPLVQRLLRVKGAHAWVVLLRHTDDTASVAELLRRKLEGQGFEVTPWWSLADFYNKTVILFSHQLWVIRVIIGLIIVLSISNTMIMSVLERTWEIGTSMAIGVSRRSILTLFLLEGLLLGVLGGVFGLAIGSLLAVILSTIGIPMPPPPGMRHGFVGGVLLTSPLALGALALAVGTTLAASVYPALRASNMPIVDALRHNH